MQAEERNKPYNTGNRTNNTVQELSGKKKKKWHRKEKGTKVTLQREVIKKQQQTNKKQIDSLRTESLVEEDFSKVRKGSAHNRKQSY